MTENELKNLLAVVTPPDEAARAAAHAHWAALAKPLGGLGRLEAMVEDAAARAERLYLGEAGELRIGFTSSAPFISAVSETLSSFRRHFPDVHIQTREINTREQIAPLNEGSLDLGLMRNTQLPDSLAWEGILREPLMAMIPHDHPLASRPAVSLAELANEPFVFFDPQVGTGLYDDILGLMRRYDLAPVITQEVGEAMTIIGLVAAGLGVSILPASFKRVQLREMRWVTIAEEDAANLKTVGDIMTYLAAHKN